MKFTILLVFLAFLLSSTVVCGQIYEDKSNVLKDKRPSATVISEANIAFMNTHAEKLKKFEVPPTLGMIEVPVKIHIIRSSKSPSTVDIKTIKGAFKKLNQYFMGIYTRFVPIIDFNYIENDKYHILNKEEEDKLCKSNDVEEMLNLYILGGIEVDGQAYCGYSRLPEGEKEEVHRIFIDENCLNNGVSLAREMGHYLTLYHTHGPLSEGKGEFVNGSNCEKEGDEICDTPADPNLTSDDVDERCGFLGKTRDKSGRKRFYKPDMHNIMSNNPLLYCCNRFSPQQYRRMLYALLHIRQGLTFPRSEYSKKQLKQMAWDKGIEGEVKIRVDGSVMKVMRDGGLFRNKINVYTSGHAYKIDVTNFRKGYVYILEGDRSRGVKQLFPQKGQSPFFYEDKKVNFKVTKYDNKPLEVDESVGEDGLNHIIVLFTRKPIKIADKVKEMNAIDEELDVIQRVYKVLGSDIIPNQNLTFSGNSLKVKGIAIDQFIAPLVIEYKQK